MKTQIGSNISVNENQDTNIPGVYLFKDECYSIVGCCMEVHRELGCVFLEAVYQEALGIVFALKEIPFVKEMKIDIFFKGNTLEKKYIADFVCYNEIILELKACDGFNTNHTAQVLNYLKASRKKIGLLVNFGTPKLEYKRLIL